MPMNEVEFDFYTPEFIPYYPGVAQKYGLNANQALLYGFIRFFTSNGKSFYFSNQQLGKMLSVSGRTIRGSIALLIKKGLLSAEYFKESWGDKRVLKINPDVHTPQANSATGRWKKQPPTEIYNTTESKSFSKEKGRLSDQITDSFKKRYQETFGEPHPSTDAEDIEERVDEIAHDRYMKVADDEGFLDRFWVWEAAIDKFFTREIQEKLNGDAHIWMFLTPQMVRKCYAQTYI